MKAKIAIVLLLALALCSAVLAQQTNPPAADAAPGVAPAAGGEQPAPAPAAVENQPAAAATRIVFQDTQLTAAIETLARQAGINYILDPRVPYGQPGPDGKILPQPSISLRWENLSAEQALTALLNNYSLQIVEDPKTRISRITVKDPAAPEPLVTRVIQLKFSSVSNMMFAVQNTLTDRRSKVVPDQRTSQLVVVATEKELTEVDALINQLDKTTRQVLIETRIMQVSQQPETVKGIDWTHTLQAQNVSYGNGVVQQALTAMLAPGTPVTTPATTIPPSTITLPGGRVITTPGSTTPAITRTPSSTVITTVGGSSGGSSGGAGGSTLSGGSVPNGFSLNTLSGLTPNIGFLNADGLHAVLSFLNTDSDAQAVATPSVVTMDNQAATINSGIRVPVRDITASTANTTAGSTLRYEEVGTTLIVTPRISANDYIYLNVAITNRDIIGNILYTVPGGGGGQDPETQSRELNTLVLIRNANTLVMGGLISDTIGNEYTKVPLLGDIPLLGLAFRHEDKHRTKQNMLVFITPTVVQDTDFQPTQTQFLKSQPFEAPRTINPKTAWEGAKPHDWSHPKP